MNKNNIYLKLGTSFNQNHMNKYVSLQWAYLAQWVMFAFAITWHLRTLSILL